MRIRTRFLYVLTVAAVATVAACKDGSDPTGPDSLFIEVVITPSTGTVNINETLQLHAAVSGPPGTPQGVLWRSVDTDFAEVNANGLVTGKSGGTARIRAKWANDTTNFTDAFVVVTETPVMEDESRGARRGR